MSVHVGEIHTELSARGPASAPSDGPSRDAEDRLPGAREDQWRSSRARVQQLEHRVCAEDSDD